MKSYPSIPRRARQAPPRLHVFDKIDGSNLRFEWNAKQGWYKFGSRNHVIDASHPVLGSGMALFLASGLGETLEGAARDFKWPSMVAFAEFSGPSSLGGGHHPTEPKTVTLFDVDVYKKGLLPPKDFIALFGGLPNVVRYLGEHTWDEDFVRGVRAGTFEGVTCEGVVGKAHVKHAIVMQKAKTQAWIDKILARYGEAAGKALIES
jgi:RNA ligase